MVISTDVIVEAYRVHEGIQCTRFVPRGAIAYFFIKTAIPYINASWNGKLSFQRHAVYFVTRTSEIYRAVGFKSLAEVKDAIDADDFVKVRRSILLNTQYVHNINPLPKIKEVGLWLKGELHTLFVSRRGLAELRRKLNARRGRRRGGRGSS